MRLFALIDANNFYVSCERIFRPDLDKKPVVVLSNNDGCFISRSNEAKALGIPMGAPLFQYKHIIKQHQVHIFSSNFVLYSDISRRLMNAIHAFIPQREIYSIDEAFIDFTGYPLAHAHYIRQYLLKSLSLPTCIGMAPTKTLAKVANHLAKHHAGYEGVCLLQTSHDIQNALQSFPVEDLWGIGRRLSVRLRQNGIHTAYDLQQTDPRWMRQHFTVVGERLVWELKGKACFDLYEQPAPKQSIQVARSFAHNVSDFENLRALVASYASQLGFKLREHRLKTSYLIVSLQTNPYELGKGNIRKSVHVELPESLHDDSNLIKASGQALTKIYQPGFPYKKAGIMALNLTPADHRQYSLFDRDPLITAKTEKIFSAIDQLNKKFGARTLYMAACGHNLYGQARTENKSPAYTTSWKELPIVFAC